MKKLLTALGLAVFLVGCASHDNGNGMGGTGEDSMKTDSINNTSSGSSDQYHNNASNGTGSSTATNNNTGGQSSP